MEGIHAMLKNGPARNGRVQLPVGLLLALGLCLNSGCSKPATTEPTAAASRVSGSGKTTNEAKTTSAGDSGTESIVPADRRADERFAVPNGSLDELFAFIQDVQQVPVDEATSPQEHQKKIAWAVVGAGEKILAASASVPEKADVLGATFDALHHLARLGEEDAAAAIDRLKRRFAQDPSAEIAAVIRQQDVELLRNGLKQEIDQQQRVLQSAMRELLDKSAAGDTRRYANLVAQSLSEPDAQGLDGPAEKLFSEALARAAVQTCEKRLAAEIPDEQVGDLLTTLFDSLRHLSMLGDPEAPAKIDTQLEKYRRDTRPTVVQVVSREELRRLLINWDTLSDEQKQQGLVSLEKFLSGPLTAGTMRFATLITQLLEEKDPSGLAGPAYQILAEAMAGSDDEAIRRDSEKMRGVARRLDLPGNEMPITGSRLDGEPFDAQSLQGKVVLVDYWATWCAPCIRELPNIKQLYDRFHDQGFEVVGISLDDDRAAVESFVQQRDIPWPILAGQDESTSGWNHPMAVQYGIQRLPTAILLDQQGKVVSLEATGPQLEQRVAELLQPTDPKAGGSGVEKAPKEIEAKNTVPALGDPSADAEPAGDPPASKVAEKPPAGETSGETQ